MYIGIVALAASTLGSAYVYYKYVITSVNFNTITIGLDYYINPKFEFIKYHDIKFINIIVYQYFDKKIQILLNDGTIIILMLLFNSTSELEEIVFEIKKRLNLV